VKVCAIILLTACSPTVALVPSSLPVVVIDHSVPGVVCSREAAEVIAALRSRERGEAEQNMIACQGETKQARAFATSEHKRAESNSWWATWGGIVTLATSIVMLGCGLAGGYALGHLK
jgi:hypothetical protein